MPTVKKSPPARWTENVQSISLVCRLTFAQTSRILDGTAAAESAYRSTDTLTGRKEDSRVTNHPQRRKRWRSDRPSVSTEGGVLPTKKIRSSSHPVSVSVPVGLFWNQDRRPSTVLGAGEFAGLDLLSTDELQLIVACPILGRWSVCNKERRRVAGVGHAHRFRDSLRKYIIWRTHKVRVLTSLRIFTFRIVSLGTNCSSTPQCTRTTAASKSYAASVDKEMCSAR